MPIVEQLNLDIETDLAFLCNGCNQKRSLADFPNVMGNSSGARPRPKICRDCQKCAGCRKIKPLVEFPYKKGQLPGPDATHTKTCYICDARKKGWDKENRPKQGQNKGVDAETDDMVELPDSRLSELELSDFLAVLGRQQDTVSLEANVNIQQLKGERREKADALAQLIWEMMNYRWLCV